MQAQKNKAPVLSFANIGGDTSRQAALNISTARMRSEIQRSSMKSRTDRMNCDELNHRIEKMNIVAKHPRPKHAYHEQIYHTDHMAPEPMMPRGKLKLNPGKRHFPVRPSPSTDELFKPSLAATQFSHRNNRESPAPLPSRPSVKLFPHANAHHMSTGNLHILQDEINQIDKELPSMRRRGNRKHYDPSKFQGQLDFQGFWPQPSPVIENKKSCSNLRASTRDSCNNPLIKSTPSKQKEAVRCWTSKGADSSNIKRIVFGLDS